MTNARQSKRHYHIVKNNSDYCLYCGKYLENWQKVVDHFFPLTANDWEAIRKDNMFVSCRECNSIKNSRQFDTIEKAREYISGVKKEHPKKPNPSANKKYYKKRPLNTIKKNCDKCGKEFKTTYSTQRFCCVGCGWEKVEPLVHVCETCGKEYKTTSPHQRFCCQKCVPARKSPKFDYGTSACKKCGNKFKR